MKRVLINLSFVFILITSLIIAFSCSDNTVTPPVVENNTIYGRITFPDTNGYFKFQDTSKGYYNVSAFANWPPTSNATANSKLTIYKDGSSGKFYADYKLVLPGNGEYVVTSSFIKLPYTPPPGVSVYGLGIYGCDTSHNQGCIFSPTISKATITNNQGVTNINFLSWVDTTQAIYKF